MSAVLNRLCKWRTLLAGWQLGTRPKGDPECDAVRDHRELTLIMRAEVNALTSLLIEKGRFTRKEFRDQVDVEAVHLMASLEERFPGVRAVDHGLSIDPEKAAPWMRDFRP